MQSQKSPRWVIFDYGGVISYPTAALPRLAERLRVSEEAFNQAYWKHRKAHDTGLSSSDYWQAVGGELGASVDQATVGWLTQEDIRSWIGKSG